MKANPKLKTICKNPYKHHYFWEHKIINNSDLWEGYFENKTITQDSKIIYTGILDSKKNIFHYGFAVYPSTYKLLGFLQNVFLPTAFFTWFDHNYDDFYIPLVSYPTIVSEVIDYTNDIDLNLVESMNNSHYFLNNLWLFDDSLLNIALKSFCEKFNNDWDKDYDKKLFLKIFDSPMDVFDFIKESIGWLDDNKFIEEELCMSLEKFKFTCDNVLTEPLLNKNFINILNINIPVLF